MSEKVLVLACLPGGDPIETTIEVDRFTKGQRTARALKILAICWGGAVFAIFIPVLHFVLVPLLLILGPIFSIVTYTKTQKIVAGEFKCPNCQNVFSMKVGPISWPQREICQSCRHHIILKLM